MSPQHTHFGNGAAHEKLDETDRMIALIESVNATFDASDPAAVESLFAAQALALDVIFKEFVRRRTYTFDNMRVALKAQAQCRMTFKSLVEFKSPRRPSAIAPARPVRRSSQSEGGNPSEQTIETAKSPA